MQAKLYLIKINLLKVLLMQIISERGKENRTSLFSQILFLITSQYYNETNKRTTKSNYFCNQYFAYNSCSKYRLKYQPKYLAHFTIFKEYRNKTPSKAALPKKVIL